MIILENIHKSYQMGNYIVQAVNGISLQIQKGEFVAIMGPSGSGKSTLLHILGCLDKPDNGRYLFNTIDINRMNDSQLAYIRNKYMGFVFQNFSLLSRNTAFKNVELPMIYGNVTDRKNRINNILNSVNLSDRSNHKPNELSGGQQQRVTIARALVNNPHILLADEPTGNLDTQSGKEIMEIIQNLNQKGLTIVLVTHDPNISTYAKRIIHVTDGKIESDEIRKDIVAVNMQGINSDDDKLKLKGKLKETLFNFTEILDSVRMAVCGLLANKLRSFLAMLGVIIGVSAVIAMISIGQGASKDITSRIESMGSNILTLFPARARSPGSRVSSAVGGSVSLKLEDATAIKKEIESIKNVAPIASKNAQVVYGSKNTNTSIYGTHPEFLEVRNFKVDEGEFFSAKEINARSKVAVLGKTVVEALFEENEDPIGKNIKINKLRFRVIGVLAEKGAGGMRDEDDQIVIPLSTAQKRLFGNDNLNSIYIQVKEEKSMDSALEKITSLLRNRHKLREGEEDDFMIRSQAELLETVKSTSRTFSMLLAGIASVSLLVGGIGIMNIMLVSVTERTREIGIRKAIGAKYRDILTQFMVEAVVICVIGGFLGVVTGILSSKVMSLIGGWSTLISLLSIIISFSFAFVIGLIFGLYPAMNAAKMNPIDALRYE